MNFITPEHITIALLSVGDCGARQIVQKCAALENSHLTAALPFGPRHVEVAVPCHDVSRQGRGQEPFAWE